MQITKQIKPLSVNECEEDCTTYHIRRGKQYDRWAQEYIDLGVEPPHPIRTDINNLMAWR